MTRLRSWSTPLVMPECIGGHVLKFKAQATMSADLARLDGYLPIVCRKCMPTTYALGVILRWPQRTVRFFELTADQFSTLRSLPEDLDFFDTLRALGWFTAEEKSA